MFRNIPKNILDQNNMKLHIMIIIYYVVLKKHTLTINDQDTK